VAIDMGLAVSDSPVPDTAFPINKVARRMEGMGI